MLSVGIGGTVYTMKSACATLKAAAAATMKEVKYMLRQLSKAKQALFTKRRLSRRDG
jgi:exopolyphosphatase/pppGpp-phosphohydrolase